ncbi:DUF1376 domain-containing protein [Pararobbsia alpina]|uniref:DUF1376 domain-containing protein n=1 Tax=Pararobbsia alpina TaxID=621374 RepID=UPI0039A4A86D
MPLDVVRVIDSDTFGLSTGDEFKTAFRLWAKSWLQVPAASLPDDDRLLAHLAGLSENMPKWKRVRDVALRGFVKCTDGRLYHPVIAEKAIEAMGRREERAEREENQQTRQQRLRERRKEMFALLRQHGIVPAWDTKTGDLERLVASLPETKPVTNSVTPGTESVAGSVTGDVTRDAPATAIDTTGHNRTVNLKTFSTSGVTGTPAPEGEKGTLPAVEISKSLIGWERERHKQARGITASNIQVIEIADLGVTDAELRRAYEAAVADREATNDPMPINAGFVKSFIEKNRRPTRVRKPRDEWDKSDEGTTRKGKELGMFAYSGESYADYRVRIRAEILKREGQAA